MKRIAKMTLSIALAISVVAALPVSAADMNEQLVTTEVESVVAAPRATSVPTTMAPTSWYNTDHDVTAKYYTYSSYLFEANTTIWVCSELEVRVDVYNVNGELIDSKDASYQEFNGYVYGYTPDETYYIVITNLSDTSISLTPGCTCCYEIIKR